MEAPLVLIASYPKSGNTWVRAVIQGLLTTRARRRHQPHRHWALRPLTPARF